MTAVTLRRVSLCGLILVLVITPVLGFAAGAEALHIWNKCPRHASHHHADVAHFVWKTTPSVSAPQAPMMTASSPERIFTDTPARAASVIASPPFVPPRA